MYKMLPRMAPVDHFPVIFIPYRHPLPAETNSKDMEPARRIRRMASVIQKRKTRGPTRSCTDRVLAVAYAEGWIFSGCCY